jgi:hypothetical protein
MTVNEKMNRLTLAIVLLLTFAALTMAESNDPFLGTFQVTGTSPGAEGQYEGTLTITKQGSVYNLSWTIGQAEGYGGIGLKVGDQLSAAYWTSDHSSVGVVVYKTGSDGSLSGIWTPQGETRIGTEKAIGKKS